jgi:hypothetical protein
MKAHEQTRTAAVADDDKAATDVARPWVAPRLRRLATSHAENSTGIGPDVETVVS